MPPTADLGSIAAFIASVFTDVFVKQIARNPILQFGTETQPLILARYLPVVQRETNEIYEEIVRIGTFIADDGAPLSPPQMKQTAQGIGFRVRLGHIDISAQMDAQDLRTLGRLINQGRDRSLAVEFVTEWLIRVIRLAIELKAEKQRAEALCDAVVTVTPMDAPPYTINLPNPPGHRITVPSGTTAAPTGFYSPTFDPIQNTLVPLRILLQNKGAEPIAIITSSRIAGVLQTNPNVARYGAGLIALPTATGDLTFENRPLSANDAVLNGILQANGLPPIIRYDRFYPLQGGGQARLFPDDKLLIIGASGRSQTLEIPDDQGRILRRELINNTLGYYGEGVSLGETEPGMVITVKSSDLKPRSVYAEGYREGFPVFLDHENVAVVTVPALAA